MGVSKRETRLDAHALFQVKSVDESARTIEGIASTPELDRQGDVMDSYGAKFKLPIPFLWQHQKDQPIGHVISATPTADGIRIKAQIAVGVLPSIDRAWALIKAGLVRGLSIGWLPLAQPTATKGGLKYSSWEWLELSAVTVPANAAATITLVKSLDAQQMAALGSQSIPFIPGATGFRTSVPMNVSEQIATLNEQIRNKSTRLEELMAASEVEGGLQDTEAAELDGLAPEIKSLTKKLDQLGALESAQLSQSRVVTTTTPSTVRHTPRVTVTDHAKELPKGTLFTRYAMAKAAGKGSISDTLAYAKRWDAQTPEVSAYIKAEAGTSVVASPGWGGELAFQNNLAAEFVELVRPQTIIGRVSGFRSVPFNVRIPVQSGGSTVNWVGEAAPKPVTELAFTTTTVPNHKMAGIVVLTDELIRLSTPEAEAVVRRDLTEQIAQFRDEQFIRVAVTAGANNPASITNGVTSPAASGTTLAALMADLNTAIGSIVSAGHSAQGLVIVTTSEVALRLSLMSTSLGQTPPGFSMNPTGGTLIGYPVIVSDSVDADTLVIFKPSEIFLADDGRVSLDASNQATLDMAGGETPDFNLWQRNCTAVRAEQWITWVKRRAGAVAVIDTIAYVPGT